jgi:hypothetical protein
MAGLVPAMTIERKPTRWLTNNYRPSSPYSLIVMAGLVPAIHGLLPFFLPLPP